MRKTKGCGFFCGLSRWWDPYEANSSRTNASFWREVSCRRFSLEEIRKATNNFAEASVVGKRNYATVYKGCIDDCDMIVAIERSNPPDAQKGFKEFVAEIDLVSRLHHPHLVSLIGYCNDKCEMILVYDYMSNGNLREHLHGTDNDPLPWKQRLEICIGAAKGLHFLHTGGKRTIIHRDVKSTNILLDDKWVGKISDFGSSLTGPSGMPNTDASDDRAKGTIGYLDPESLIDLKLTEKSDVYSFGAVLFEVLCARPVIVLDGPEEERFLVLWAAQCMGNGTVDQIIDPYLTGKIAPVCLKEFLTIAKSCVRQTGIERPMMGDVVEGLEFALRLQESADAANEENDSGDDEPHNEYIYRGMSFGESIITSARTDAVSSQT
ncbi:hypothetical protein L1049_020666 [Liquidambar formosana]|uniref:Protein kinase domain-containing protein n=1 Tax=Liquidambar formosana TaxID=63359 RepID=A0AAP0X7K6_LIQFO